VNARLRPWSPGVARQLGVEATALDRWSNRAQTRREQIGDIMKAHGFTAFGREVAAMTVRWLTPTAQIERRPQRLIEILLAELRRRQILLPPPRVLELVVHRARAAAAKVTWRGLAGDLTTARIEALHTLFDAAPGREDLSCLARLRRFPAAPGARSMHALIERLDVVRALGVERRRQVAVPAVAFDAVATDAMAMTVQNLRVLAPPSRRALLVAAVLRLEADLTDAALFMFDRLMGRAARKAERASTDGAAAIMRGLQDHLKPLPRAGRAVITAHEADGDGHDAIDHAVG
jgi:hypothetical protein